MTAKAKSRLLLVAMRISGKRHEAGSIVELPEDVAKYHDDRNETAAPGKTQAAAPSSSES